MSDANELFPFPSKNSEELPENSELPDNSLPVFPGSASVQTEPALSEPELREIRKLLAAFKCSHPEPAAAPVMAPPPLTTVSTTMPAGDQLQEKINKIWSQFSSVDPVEIEAISSFREIMKECPDDAMLLKILWCLAGIFPIKKNLRHGTPDQKMFTLNVLGDRFLQGLAGVALGSRKRLLKAVGKYFSDTSEVLSFISMENEPFNVQYHERVPGASSSGKVIREMHGFLVVAKDSNKVVRLGQVLT